LTRYYRSSPNGLALPQG